MAGKKKNDPADSNPERKKTAQGKKTAAKAKTAKGKKAADIDNEENPDENGSVDINRMWGEDGLSQALLAAITDDKQIKQGLYPPPGAHASTAKGGGKPKTEFYWRLCVILFSEHQRYSTAFKLVTELKQKATWGNKIKNRLRIMAKQTRDYMEEMGETGAGITKEDEIDMTQDNKFTTKWKMISDTCPWFWDMHALIAERPNVVPKGLGNSGTEIDLLIVNPGMSTQDYKIADESQNGESSDGYGVAMPDGAEDLDDDGGKSWRKSQTPETKHDKEEQPVIPEKRKHDSNYCKTPARPGTSKPATSSKPSAKKTKVEEFSDVAKAEEETCQREIDLVKAKVKSSVAKASAKYQAKAALQVKKLELESAERMEKQQLRAQMMVEKMRHDVRMAELQSNHTSHAGPSAHSSVLPSMSNASTPTYSRESSTPFSGIAASGFASNNYTPAAEELLPYPVANTHERVPSMSTEFNFDVSLMDGTFGDEQGA